MAYLGQVRRQEAGTAVEGEPRVPQKRVLIVTFPEDLHGQAVAWAIREKGHVCSILSCTDLPTLSSITLRESNSVAASSAAVRHAHSELDISLDTPFDSVWVRRRHFPWLPTSMHPGDREVSKSQCDRLLSDFFVALDGEDVLWVNHYEREPIGQLKVHQLREARRAGLTIPETLVSNDPAEIRAFIESCGGVAAHKLLQQSSWRTGREGQFLTCYTRPVTVADLPRDETLRLCPGIFQPLLAKRIEVRVACFGDCQMALQIDSQSDERSLYDWRVAQFHIGMEPYDLPEPLAGKIRRFLRSTGLASASLDFIVTPEGEHVFLEANPQGMFLWMEIRAGLSLLDSFSEFLISGSADFQYRPSTTPATWKRFTEAWHGGLKEVVHKSVLEREPLSVLE